MEQARAAGAWKAVGRGSCQVHFKIAVVSASGGAEPGEQYGTVPAAKVIGALPLSKKSGLRPRPGGPAEPVRAELRMGAVITWRR